MNSSVKYLFAISLLVVSLLGFSQNENSKWYFGNQAGLDFITNPPTILTNGVINTSEGCSGIANTVGNLLFYTDGITVWNSSHVMMANGNGLNGNLSTSQSAVVVKKPGSSTIYFIFTLAVCGNGTGVNYSTIDMSLASGSGSVVTKNTSLFTGSSSERLTSVRHCNGIDVWVLSQETSTGNFRAHLVTALGVNTTPVISAIGTNIGTGSACVGYMKFSPNGRKLALAAANSSAVGFEIYDFDPSTGVVSNRLALINNTAAYGVEFSPDGTKLYGALWGGPTLYQWNLCAGSNTAIIASLSTNITNGGGALQLGINGKIYMARVGQSFMGVINNPNASGSACNYVDNGQSIAPKVNQYGLPNFITSGFKPPIPPYTYTVSNSFGCQTASFTPPPIIQNFSIISCAASGYSLTGMQWNFGDPLSGSANISNIQSPSHAFSNLGTYTVSLVIYYSCGGGTDTLRQVVNINQPCITVSSTSITCSTLGSATVIPTGGLGPYSYTWTPSAQNSSVATGLSPGYYTLTVFDFGNNFTYTAQTSFTSLIPLTGNVSVASSVSCYGASTGTGAITGLAGGSGTQSFSWFNGLNTYTTAFTNSLSAGIWSVNVTDALTGCQINQSIYISQPPSLVLTITASSPSACAGNSAMISGTNSGGSPISPGSGYTYTWTSGPALDSYTVIELTSGVHIYTLNSEDGNNCLTSSTIAVNFVNNPTITVSSVSVCPLETGTLTAFGASTYTWNATSVGSTFTDSPIVNSQYAVVGSALGCTSTAAGSIILQPVPVPLFNSNSPVCNTQALQLSGAGGSSYNWTGPLSFTSTQQFPVLNPATPYNSGAYNVTVTSVNGCTAATSATLTVNPTPTLSAFGSTVCNTGTLTLSANSVPGAAFSWTGPLGFTSNLQNPVYHLPTANRSGFYTVTASSAVGCTNTAVANVTVTSLPSPVANHDGPKCVGSTINFSGSGALNYFWLGPGGFSSTLQNPQINSVSMVAMGSYTLTVTTGPCVNTAIKSLTVYPLPTSLATNNGPVCENKKLRLFATTGSTVTNYYWYGPLFLSPLQNPIRDSAKLFFSGIYTLTVQDYHLCQASAQTTVIILQNPNVTATGATVCLNDPATLSAGGASSYFWTGPLFFQSSVAGPFITSVTLGRNGTYTVVGTAANTCSSTTMVNVVTRSLPSPSMTVLPKARVCLNDDLTLSGSGGQKYQWYGPSAIYYEGQSVNFVARSLSASGTYTLKVSDDTGCAASIYSLITIDNLPDGTLMGSKMEGCVPLCSGFVFTPSSSSSGKMSASWQMNGMIENAQKFSHCFTEVGEHAISGTLYDSTTNCSNKVEFYVRAFPEPEADFEYSPLKPIENADRVIFTNTSKGGEQISWNWFFINRKDYETSVENTSYLFQEQGKYPVALIVRNRWGCVDSVTKVITVEEDFTMYIPNVFTPNEDNRNEAFLPMGRGVSSYYISIYNRWGAKIFESSDITNGWDGMYKGEPCQSDVYTWKMEVRSIHGENKIVTGNVTLLR